MKSLFSSLRHFVVQKARLSKTGAVEYIFSGRVLVNGQKGKLNQPVQPEDEIQLDGKILKEPQQFTYIAYYKPRGVESTLNPEIDNNLAQAIDLEQRVFPVGRLDKESEGLLLLTDDGHFYNQISHSENHQEKEYVVTVNKPLSPEALDKLAAGVEIMGQKTRSAQVKQISATEFSIVLTQGLNRQIRRMCYKLGFEVERLVRVRMVNVEIGKMEPGDWRYLRKEEVEICRDRL